MAYLVSRFPGTIRLTDCLAAIVMIIAVCIGGSGGAAARVLVIGSISLDPVGETRVFQPFADYLAGKLTSHGITGAKVAVANSIGGMAGMIRKREVDIFIDSSVTALMVNELAGSKFLLRRWKHGREAYRSVVVVRRDSAFASLTDLTGETIAFEEPFSTAGYVLPALALTNAGLTLVALDGTAQTPPAGSVGYVMGYDSETQMTWVERDQVAAAAMAENDFRSLAVSALVPLRILHTSPAVPYHVVVYGDHLKDSLVSRIRAVLLDAHDSQLGAHMLDGFEQTIMFDEIPSDLLQNVETLAPGLDKLTKREVE
ncbi:phosphate/phosphite/phosphonate ABC transporter substrate-binding protein [Hwanghaeella sp.]|uniref:phosphate/phosphite/phosphonate ABC transporter substrate-binding protein n=1 Tax=Hwanghaeella sp. TaxID=2605943 RepID=UPI003CCB9A73